MATMNPLERKARNSFFKGMLLAGLIGVIGIAILVMQLLNMRADEKERLASLTTIYVLNQDVSSGQVITADMMTAKDLESSVIPANAVDSVSDYYLRDQNGNQIISGRDNEGNPALAVVIDGNNYQLTTDDYMTGTINRNGVQEPIIISGSPVIAKVDLMANTILTSETIAESNELTDDTTRTQQYNVLSLPADLETGNIIDVRLRMPDGTDYIVVSKKTITVLDEAGVPSLDTVSLELNEDEILTMSNAIVEAYQIPGSMLYVTKYVEPGIQAEATTTYVPSAEVQSLIYSDPNIVNEAKQALSDRYNPNAGNRNNINDALGRIDQDERDSAVESGTSEEITSGQDARQRYLDSLSQ